MGRSEHQRKISNDQSLNFAKHAHKTGFSNHDLDYFEQVIHQFLEEI